jgi:hypothetical protein
MTIVTTGDRHRSVLNFPQRLEPLIFGLLGQSLAGIQLCANFPVGQKYDEALNKWDINENMFGFSVPEDVYSVKSTIVSMSVLGFTVAALIKTPLIEPGHYYVTLAFKLLPHPQPRFHLPHGLKLVLGDGRGLRSKGGSLAGDH